MKNFTYDEIKIGDTASLEKILTNEDIKIFAAMTGDVNPVHLDPDFAKTSIFGNVVAHGMWGSVFFSTLLGTKLPGLGTVYLSQTLNFLAPVYLGDTIKVEVEVKTKDDLKKRITFECRCINQNQKTVIKGEALVIAPKEKIEHEDINLPPLGFLA
ncbi:MAG: MaoC/PaaZ C-terminal domain-containing protein [Candidatus Margulisiibacteriota bacterium]|jgi:acyl dehydratase